jgi:autotransporter-associated beta strand protein
MKSATRGAWRFIRCLLLIACAGGILAADNTWLSSINLEAIQPGNWFASAAESDLADMSAISERPAYTPLESHISMGRLINGLLFSHSSARSPFSPIAFETSSLAARNAELAPINQSTSSDNSASFTTFAASSTSIARPSGGVAPSTITNGTGEWAVDSSGTWSNAANWVSNLVPDGAGAFANFSKVDLTADRTVTLDSSRSVGTLTIGDTNGTHHYTLDASPGATLTFDQTSFGFTGILTQSATSAGDTISAPILVGNVNYLSVQNNSTAPLTISGSIASTGGSKLIEFDSGHVNVTGVISNGATGNFLQVGVVGSSIVTLTGTNTYTGGTSVVGGTLFINGDNSGATGSVSVANSGSLLGGTGISGGPVSVGGGATITGGDATTVGTFTIGTLTLHQNLSFNPGEISSTYLVNLLGSTSDKLIVTGALNLTSNFGDHISFSGTADGISTYVLATYSSVNGIFNSVDNLPAGYQLLYLPNELDLVPIAVPEPSTWFGAALALVALLVVAQRRRRLL